MSSQTPVPSPDELPVNPSIGALAAAIVGIALLVLLLPLFQTIGYLVFVQTPALLWWTGIGLAVVLVGSLLSENTVDFRALVVGVAIVLVLGLVVGPAVSDLYGREYTAGQVQSDATRADALPNNSQEHVRVLPRQVGDKYAQSSLQFPQYRATTSDITYVDGNYSWSYGLVPDNVFVSLLDEQRGALYVNMERSEKSVRVRETPFQNGIGQIVTDSFGYQTNLDRLDVMHQPDTRFVFERNSEAYIAQSYVTHQWRFRLLPLPQPYVVPRFGGVQVMNQEGSIRDVPAEQVDDASLLTGQNVYPYRLVRYQVRSTKYSNGLLNRFFAKEGVLQLAALPADDNNWPVTVPVESPEPRLTYYVATEPVGSGSGVFEIWTFDSQTGEPAVRQYDSAQIGPRKATKFVRQDKTVARLNNVEAVEPVPVVTNGTLYWQVKVIPRSSNGITYTGFVNANTGTTRLISKPGRIRAFVTDAGVTLTDASSDASRPSTSGSETTVSIVVTGPNGSVVERSNATVPENGSVNVEISDNASGTGS